MYDNGPTLCITSPAIYLALLFQKSFVHTLSPGRNSQGLLCSSWCCFCFACAAHTVLLRLGFIISSQVCKERPMSNVQGATFVVLCDVVL